jgi:outer membrane protein assembly factor BamE (lipoprotein component of BamABCDE complex)
VPESSERRGWSRRMIVWSVVLVVVAFAAAWGVSNWKIVYYWHCKRLMRSPEVERQVEGLQKMGALQLKPGLTREQVRNIFSPLLVDGPLEGEPSDYKKAARETGFYLAHPPADDDGIALVFDAAGRLEKWWTVP